jgi:hypothetical protein
MTTKDRTASTTQTASSTATPAKVTPEQAKALKIARRIARRDAELLRRLA